MTRQQPTRLYGARVSRPGGGDKILIEQSSRQNIPRSNNPYTIDQGADGQNIAKFVDYHDDHQVAEAVRATLDGKLNDS